MKTTLALPLVIAGALQLAACMPAMKSYPDPAFHKASYKDVTKADSPVPVKVEVQFQNDGTPKAASDSSLRAHVERTLVNSGVFVPSATSSSQFKVVVNNVANRGDAVGVGIITGLSFGFSGGMVTDEYQFKIAYTAANGTKKDAFFRHAMHTAVGGVDLPQGFAPLTPEDAYSKIVEDAVLNFVKEYQTDQLASR